MWFRLNQAYGSWNKNRVHFLTKQTTFHVANTTDQYKSQIGPKFSVWIHSQIWPISRQGQGCVHGLHSDPVQKSLDGSERTREFLVQVLNWCRRWIQDTPPWSPEETWESWEYSDPSRDLQDFPGPELANSYQSRQATPQVLHRLLQGVTNMLPQFLHPSKLSQCLLSLCHLIQALFPCHWDCTLQSSSKEQEAFLSLWGLLIHIVLQ